MADSRRSFLTTSLGAAGALAASGFPFPRISLAADDTIFLGLLCDQTGSYSADGQDLQKGYELAIEDLNAGTGVMGKVLGGKKGVLGKKIVYKIADTQTKPDPAVQRATEFITQDKATMFTGGVSTAEVIAMEKTAQANKVLYMTGASGSNDTTGKDCQRYAFRSQCDAYMVAKALAPVLAAKLGKKRRAVYLVPDYSYGHSLADSMKEFTEKEGWTTVAQVVAPFPTSDYSSYLTNIANANADTFVNIEFGNDGVSSTKQAAQFGVLKKMQLVVPNFSSYFADGVGAEIMSGVYGTLPWSFRLQDRYPMAKMFVESFTKKFGIRPRWTAQIAYDQIAIWADACYRARSVASADVIRVLEEGHPIELSLGKVSYRAGDHQLVRPVPIVLGKKPEAMQGKDDFFDILEVVPGESVMQPLNLTGCTLPPV